MRVAMGWASKRISMHVRFITNRSRRLGPTSRVGGFDDEAKISLASISGSFYATAFDMETVTVSPKFQVVIPLSIRRELDLKPGMKLHVFRRDESVEFMPLKSMKGMRGFLKGIDTSIQREDDRL